MATLADKMTADVTAALEAQVSGITRDVLAQVETHVVDALDAIRGDAATKLDALTATQPERPDFEFTPEAPVDAKADAKERALRTAKQGLLGVLATVVITVGDALATPGFDLFDISDWKIVIGGVGTAIVATGVAFVSRLLKAPKSQR